MQDEYTDYSEYGEVRPRRRRRKKANWAGIIFWLVILAIIIAIIVILCIPRDQDEDTGRGGSRGGIVDSLDESGSEDDPDIPVIFGPGKEDDDTKDPSADTTVPEATKPTEEATKPTEEETTEATTEETTEETTEPEEEEDDDTATEKSEVGQKAANVAKSVLGYAYEYGGEGPNSFDTSGLIYYCFRASGLSAPRAMYDQVNFGKAVNKEDLQPGDVLFFYLDNPGKAEYVGIYVGDGVFIAARSSQNCIGELRLDNPYFAERYVCARRYY